MSCWQLQNSGHWFTPLYFKMYMITARKDKWVFSLNCMEKNTEQDLKLTKTLQVCDRQLLATEISDFTDTTVGTCNLWTKICLKDNNESSPPPHTHTGTLWELHSWQFYILHTNNWDIAYNLKITNTVLEGPTIYGSSAALTSHFISA